MATANFMRYEANNIYMLDIENNTVEELKEMLQDRIAGLNMKDVTKGPMNNEIKLNPNYPLEYVTSVCANKSYGDVDFEICVHVMILNGYYEGINVDYSTDVYINGILDGDMSVIRDGYFHLIDYTDKMNKGICTIQTKNVKRWANKVHAEIVEKLETILAKSSKSVLSVKSSFSNGETIYEEMEQEEVEDTFEDIKEDNLGEDDLDAVNDLLGF